MEFDRPQSRNEAILQNMLGASNLLEPPQSRIEALLQKIAEKMPEANPSEGTTTGTLDRLKIGDEIYSVEGGGGGGGIRPIGVTTTPLYDGATTNPIQINGESYTAETGDMVTYQSTEFLFNVNEVWQELGDVSVVLAIIDDIFADIAPAFDATSTYAVGDYVIYNDQLYKCTTAHTGAWAAADFTATSLSDEIKNNKGTVYTAGKYINIDANNEISVDPVVPNEAFTYIIEEPADYTLKVTKSVGGVVAFEQTYIATSWDVPIDVTLDNAIRIYTSLTGTMFYELVIASDTHDAGFKQNISWFGRGSWTETFSTVDHSGEKLITKSDMDAALAGKQGVLTTGSHIEIDDDTISVNRWAVPAGKVVYTVITSDENYGQNVHVQRHTSSGSFIDDRTFICEMYKTVDIDGLISIQNPYASFNITLLADSDEQQAGYRYTVNPNTTPTSNSFTFTLPQEENDNDLIIREELDAVSDAVDAIKDGTDIDSFGDVETALAGKQDNLTAGNYIKFEDDEISVKRLVLDGDEYTYEIYTKSTQTHVVVDKYDSNSTLVSTREYYMNDLSPAVEVDGLFTLYAYGGPWTCTLLVASKDHEAGYSFSCQWNVYTHYPETFELPPEESPNDLIIREELNAVMSGVGVIVTEDKSYQYTVNANVGTNITAEDFGIVTPTGYTPIAFARVVTGNDNVIIRNMSPVKTGSTTMLGLFNTSSNAVTATAIVQIVYVKTGAIIH